MAGSEAKIRIGIDGANDVRNALRLIRSDFSSLGSAGEKIGGTLKGIANGFVRLGGDAARAANDMKAIDFGSAADRFKALDDSLTRMAVKGGRSVGELRTKFSDFASVAGVSTAKFADSVRQFDRNTFSGIDDAAEAMRAIGIAAEDADMSLEELAGLGGDLYQKLGVPASRVGDELKRIKELAADASIPGGLSAMAGILSRQIRMGGDRVGGGAQRLGAIQTALMQQGNSPEVAAQLGERIIAMQNSLPVHLVKRAIRSLPGVGKGFEPYERNAATGRVELSEAGQEHLQRVFKRAPNVMAGLMGHLGMGVEGLEAASAFANLNYGRVRSIQDLPERLKAGGAFDLSDLKPGGSADAAARELYARMLGKGGAPEGSEFSRTEAGQRIRTENEKAAVEMGVGAKVQRARDRRDAYYKGRRGTQAAIDTITSYMPGQVQDAIHLGEAASFTTPGLPGRIDPQSEGLAAAARALHSAAEKLDKMPAATAAAIQKVDLKVREAPLGAAREAARTGY